MSEFSKFVPPAHTLDPEVLAALGDLYDRACARYCSGPTDSICKVMAGKLIGAAMEGERDPEALWQVAVRGF